MSRATGLPLFRSILILALVIPTLVTSAIAADDPDADDHETEKKGDRSKLTVQRIYVGKEFDAASFSGRWLSDQSAYTTFEPSATVDGGKDIVRHDASTGDQSVMVSAASLIPPGATSPLKVEAHSWSKDHNLLLIYTNSKRVWRQNTRGDYWLLDRSSRQLRKLGGDAPPSSMMFAKISPDGKNVAYVRERNLYVEDLFDHKIRRITDSESEDLINGTTDWVYEEELGLRDAFRWSPDGKWIAFWQINTEGVQKFPLVNHTDSLYPTVKWFAYPKVGQRNPSCRIGIIHCQTAERRMVDLPGDPRDHYVPRIHFLPTEEDVDDLPRLLIQQLNRLQNTNRLFLADLRSASVSEVLVESDEAWVDVHDELNWLDNGRRFTWISDRDGWRHIYIASLDGGEPLQVTSGEFDVIELVHVDHYPTASKVGGLYFIASPDSASERYLYRVEIDGSDLKRITPPDFVGSHAYKFADGSKWAIHTRSSADIPPTTQLISLDDHRVVRVLEENKKLRENLDHLSSSPVEFFRTAISDETELDGWCIKPPDFDPAKKYPLLCYVYGEPAGTTVVNRWGGKSYLWHRMLAQHGYVVMSFDNRGTKAPRGRAFRKSIYKKIGILPPQDQAAAVRAVIENRSYLDPKRVGVWGWSGGGSSSLHAIFKYPDLYSTAIAIAPVPNQRYYDTIYQERYMSLPELNVEGFRQGSPINFAKNLKGNLLLVHGTGDDNCHYQTTEMLIDELVAHNKQFRLMVYPNRTHSIRERKNTTRHLREMMTEYLLQHLPPGKPTPAS